MIGSQMCHYSACRWFVFNRGISVRVIAFLLFFVASSAHSQELCEALLQHGIFNESLVEEDSISYSHKEAKQRFCAREIRSAEEAEAYGLDFLLSVIPLSYDAQLESYEQFQLNVCELDWEQYFNQREQREVLQAAQADNRTRALAWSQCMGETGIQLSYSIVSDASFNVRISLRGEAADRLEFLQDELSISPGNAAYCEPINPTMGADITLKCQRGSNGPLSLVAHTTFGARQINIPAKPKRAKTWVDVEPWNTVAQLHTKGALLRGVWSEFTRCPKDSFATAFRLKIEPFQSRGQYDDTALNAVQLLCFGATPDATMTLSALEGDYGAWSEWVSCPGSSVLSAYQLKHHPKQWSGDDAGGIAVRFGCRSLASKKRVVRARLKADNEITWGEFLPVSSCPANSGICAMSTRYLPYQGNSIIGDFDDLSISDVRFECCALSGS